MTSEQKTDLIKRFILARNSYWLLTDVNINRGRTLTPCSAFYNNNIFWANTPQGGQYWANEHRKLVTFDFMYLS